MIVKSSFRRAGGLGRHLLRGEGNEEIVVRHDLFRNAPDDPMQALRYFAALTDASPRTGRHFCHVVVSPSEALDGKQLARVRSTIEREFGICDDHPCILVEHKKGDRPQHFHFVYPVVHPTIGRAIKSHDYRLKDHCAARALELEFGHEITLSDWDHRNETVAKHLRQQGIDTARLRAVMQDSRQSSNAHRIANKDLQQASRLHIEPRDIGGRVSECFEAAPDLKSFKANLEAQGFRLAMGQKTVQVVEGEMGGYFDLARLLRNAARAEGKKRSIKQDELVDAFGPLDDLDDVRVHILNIRLQQLEGEVEIEQELLQREADVDGDEPCEARVTKPSNKTSATIGDNATWKARHQAILAEQRMRDEIRRRRVDRAFKFAEWFDCHEARQIAYLAAACGVLLAGGGLGLAVVAGCIAVSQVPTRERARTLAYHERLIRIEEWSTTRRKLYDLKREVERSKKFPPEMRRRAEAYSVENMIEELRAYRGESEAKGVIVKGTRPVYAEQDAEFRERARQLTLRRKRSRDLGR